MKEEDNHLQYEAKIIYKDVLDIHHQLKESGVKMNPSEEVNETMLNSAVNAIYAGFGGEEIYPTVYQKAAALWHGIANNHAFVDGNKRTAIQSALCFLAMHGYMLEYTQDELVDMAIKVGSDNSVDVRQKLACWIKERAVEDDSIVEMLNDDDLIDIVMDEDDDYFEGVSEMKHLVIIGVGGFAREVYWYAQDSRGYGVTWDLKGFLDGDVRLDEEEYRKLELPVLGDVKSYEIQEDDVFTCAVGTPKVKEKLVSIMEARGGNFINIIHNTVIIQGNVTIGKGIIVCPWVSLNDHSKIGNHVMFGAHGGMAHDSSVGDYSCFMGGAGLCGNVQAGRGTYWGDGATALPHSVIGDYAYIGCRSVVFKKVKTGQKVFGNPALPI